MKHVNWNMSIGKAFSLPIQDINHIELLKIKDHLNEFGFKFKASHSGHCYVEMSTKVEMSFSTLSGVPEAKTFKILKQEGVVRFDPKSPLRDLLHELDHIYQLQHDKSTSGKDFFKTSRVEFYLINIDGNHRPIHVPSIAATSLFDAIESKNSFDLSIDTLLLPGLTNRHKLRLSDLVNLLKSLNSDDTKRLFELFLSRQDNSVMEMAAYCREINRKSYPPLALTYTEEGEIRSRQSDFTNYYNSCCLDLRKNSFFSNTWSQPNDVDRLKNLPHEYLNKNKL